MKKIDNWPEGTKFKKISDGKEEIKLPRPTNVEKFSRKQLRKREEETVENNVLNYPIHQQGGVNKADKVTDLWEAKARKINPRRQEEINKQRREEREFKRKVNE
ncbi:MAG: hypothetical protein U9R06_03750 [Patescibacteria group bacterium]|nr:hypothetical protein [Patescibacteria group bacterium]